MAKVRTPATADIQKKYTDVTPGRAGYYEAGVKAPKADWETNTIAASGNFKAAVSAGDIQRRFAGGVKRAGTPKWQRKASTLGRDRYGAGVSAAGPDFGAGIDPFIATLAGLDISERKPRGDPGNLDRVRQVADALFKKRIALMGAGI